MYSKNKSLTIIAEKKTYKNPRFSQYRAGLAFDGRIDIDATYVKTTAEYNLFSEPELHLKADLEFHSGVALCLQLHQPTSSMR